MPEPAAVTRVDASPKSKVILGPDGKPCRTCNSLSDLKNSAKAFGGGSALAAVATKTAGTRKDNECPPDLDALGRATWTFLHTTAAYYPNQPSRAHQTSMLNLLNSLPTLYPCHVCADHLKEEVKSHPPDSAVSTREGVMEWLCRRHNEVNNQLGKRLWKCTVSELDERWKDGPADGHCD
jgi:FAD-linked sulfhydryl oxidase